MRLLVSTLKNLSPHKSVAPRSDRIEEVLGSVIVDNCYTGDR